MCSWPVGVHLCSPLQDPGGKATLGKRPVGPLGAAAGLRWSWVCVMGDAALTGPLLEGTSWTWSQLLGQVGGVGAPPPTRGCD